MECRKFPEYDVLRHIRVLVLVDEDISEHIRNFLIRFRRIAEEYVHIQENVVEIHNSGLSALLRIQCVYLIDSRHFATTILLNGIRALTIFRGGYEIILRIRNTRLYVFWLVDFIVKLHFLQTCLYETDGIVGVIYRKVRFVANLGGIIAEQTYKNRVKCAHIETTGLSRTHHERDSLLHFLRRLVGESQGQNLLRLTSEIEDIGDSASKDSRLPGTCARHYQHRPFNTLNCLFLNRIQPLKGRTQTVFHLYVSLFGFGVRI